MLIRFVSVRLSDALLRCISRSKFIFLTTLVILIILFRFLDHRSTLSRRRGSGRRSLCRIRNLLLVICSVWRWCFLLLLLLLLPFGISLRDLSQRVQLLRAHLHTQVLRRVFVQRHEYILVWGGVHGRVGNKWLSVLWYVDAQLTIRMLELYKKIKVG